MGDGGWRAALSGEALAETEAMGEGGCFCSLS
jgi:hypothetical protein